VEDKRALTPTLRERSASFNLHARDHEKHCGRRLCERFNDFDRLGRADRAGPTVRTQVVLKVAAAVVKFGGLLDGELVTRVVGEVVADLIQLLDPARKDRHRPRFAEELALAIERHPHPALL